MDERCFPNFNLFQVHLRYIVVGGFIHIFGEFSPRKLGKMKPF